MKILKVKLIFVFVASAILLCACPNREDANQAGNANRGNTANNSNTNTAAPEDDTEELGKIIALPLMPEEVLWRETSAEDTKRKKIIAVLKFSAQDAQNLVTQSEKYGPPKAENIDVETWFPAELVAQSQLSGDETLKGMSYGANAFFQNAYNNGKITRIEDTNYFILELNSN